MTPKTRRTSLLVALVGLAVVLSGCASNKVDTAALERTWVLESFGAPAGLTPADPAVTTDMTLSGGNVSGSGGVNSYSGTYEAKDSGSILFGPLAATQMAGPTAAMEQEAAFLAALQKTRSFELNGGKLVLSDMDNNTLVVLAAK